MGPFGGCGTGVRTSPLHRPRRSEKIGTCVSVPFLRAAVSVWPGESVVGRLADSRPPGDLTPQGDIEDRPQDMCIVGREVAATIAECPIVEAVQDLVRAAYESQAAGKRLNAMLSMGLSRPWPDALEALTGSRQMDASAILDYFEPLKVWLESQTKGQPIGW